MRCLIVPRRFLIAFLVLSSLALAGSLVSNREAGAQVFGVLCGGKAGQTSDGLYGCNGLCVSPFRRCAPVYSNRTDKNGQIKLPTCRCLWAYVIIVTTGA
jgi:hypothetical protein